MGLDYMSLAEAPDMAFVPLRTPRRRFGFPSKIFSKEVSGICATCAIFVIGVFFVISLLALTMQTDPPVVNVVVIDTEAPLLFRTSPYYTSIALDSSVIADGLNNFNPSSHKLIHMLSHLGPCYLRIGGTMADRLLFDPSEHFLFKSALSLDSDGGVYSYEGYNAKHSHFPNFTMSGSEWLQLNQMAKQANLIIIFDLNCLIRYEDGSWNSKNAEQLISFSSNHSLDVVWELGNEPNSFRHVFNYALNATQLAKDFIQLRAILNKYPLYANSILVGPDVTRPTTSQMPSESYLNEFLRHINKAIDAVTFHQYYFNGRTASLIDFVSPRMFNVLEEQIAHIKQIVAKNGYSNLPVWLGETSSAYGGGSPGYSNRYISTFIWLDKLGLAARSGIDLVVRQSIFKGYYALLGEKYEPNPDWWITVLYKSFVGPEVVSCYTATNPRVRLYCHCTSNDIYKDGNALTVFGMNMQDNEAKIRIEGLTNNANNKIMPLVYGYIVSPNLSIVSKTVLLNGHTLNMSPHGELPVFEPVLFKKVSHVSIPPYSSAFFVIPNTNVKACMEN